MGKAITKKPAKKVSKKAPVQSKDSKPLPKYGKKFVVNESAVHRRAVQKHIDSSDMTNVVDTINKSLGLSPQEIDVGDMVSVRTKFIVKRVPKKGEVGVQLVGVEDVFNDRVLNFRIEELQKVKHD